VAENGSKWAKMRLSSELRGEAKKEVKRKTKKV
jgi:hypothetical protein